MAKACVFYSNLLSGAKGSSRQRGQLLCFIWVILLMFVAGSCKNNKPKVGVKDKLSPAQRHIADSLQLANNIDSADYRLLFKNKTNAWLSKILVSNHSTWGDFRLLEYYTDTHQVYADTPVNKFLTGYAMFLKWSPDSAYILDYGSFGITMSRNKTGKLYVESGDVDLQVSVLNYKEKTSKRLLIFAPGSYPLYARWMDSSQVALVSLIGTTEHRHPDTLLWMFNAKNNLLRKYKYVRQNG